MNTALPLSPDDRSAPGPQCGDGRLTPIRVLVIRAGQLGDTIFVTSVIEPLRQMYGPAVQIDLVVKSGLENLFSDDPRIDHVFGIRHRHLALPLNPDKLQIVRASYRAPYDVLINFELGNQFPLLVRLIKARQKYGRPYQFIADDDPASHAVEHVRRIMGLLLPPDKMILAHPHLVGSDFPPLRDRLQLPAEYIVLNPTNSQFMKRDYRSYRAWPVAHWRQLMADLTATRREKIVLIGNQGEREYFALLEPLPTGVISIAGRTTITELIAVLQHARALITTDTGPSHLAAAVGTPVLAIFGPSDHRKTGPFPTPGNSVNITTLALECSPCSLTGAIRQCPANRCLLDLLPTQVLTDLATLID